MKYLGIHKLVWAILVVASTFLEVIFLSMGFMLYALWMLRFPKFKNIWQNFHSAEGPWDNHWDGEPYMDNNPWETIKRRYKIFF